MYLNPPCEDASILQFGKSSFLRFADSTALHGGQVQFSLHTAPFSPLGTAWGASPARNGATAITIRIYVRDLA